jgi:hypothetical protein
MRALARAVMIVAMSPGSLTVRLAAATLVSLAVLAFAGPAHAGVFGAGKVLAGGCPQCAHGGDPLRKSASAAHGFVMRRGLTRTTDSIERRRRP